MTNRPTDGLGTSYEVYKYVGEYSCGTTNVDYSQELYNEFQKIRSYKSTLFEVDPSGFEVNTQNEETYKEVKIDLPDSWVRGFLTGELGDELADDELRAASDGSAQLSVRAQAPS